MCPFNLWNHWPKFKIIINTNSIRPHSSSLITFILYKYKCSFIFIFILKIFLIKFRRHKYITLSPFFFWTISIFIYFLIFWGFWNPNLFEIILQFHLFERAGQISVWNRTEVPIIWADDVLQPIAPDGKKHQFDIPPSPSWQQWLTIVSKV